MKPRRWVESALVAVQVGLVAVAAYRMPTLMGSSRDVGPEATFVMCMGLMGAVNQLTLSDKAARRRWLPLFLLILAAPPLFEAVSSFVGSRRLGSAMTIASMTVVQPIPALALSAAIGLIPWIVRRAIRGDIPRNRPADDH